MAQKKTWIARYWWLALIAGGLLVACTAAAIAAALIIPTMTTTSQDHTNPIISDSSTSSTGGVSTSSGSDNRLPVQLSAGQEGPQPTEIVPVVIGEPLSDEQVEEIFARLPTLIPDDADQVDFKIPDEPLPPPRTGDTIDETFPPPPPPVEVAHVEPGPLEVLRFSPEGEIALAPFVSVTFNQPMVPLTTIEDLAAGEVPLRIEPALPGTWRWVGTKTLTFQYDSVEIDRLPKATDYILTVPAGTESATGGVLAEAVSWSFRTPPPLVTDHSPSRDPQPLDPTFYFAFDQRIDSQAVLDTIAVTAGDQTFNLELVEMENIPRVEQLNRRIENAGEGRWLAFRATELLPVDSTISIAIGPGTPSAEGPLVTETAQTFSFQTFAPLRIEEHGCTWSHDRCPPLTPFFIEFNNPLDPDAYDESMLAIEPSLTGASVDIFGDRIQIRGATEGQTTYRITVDGDIQDIFGQTLGKDTTLRFRVDSADPFLVGPDELLVTLDPAAEKPVFSVYALNYDDLDVKIYAVHPSDWPAFMEYMREFDRQDPSPDPPGRLVHDETMHLDAQADILTEAGIDLSSVMDSDYGHFILIVEPKRPLLDLNRDWYRTTVQAWVQVTQIGLDAFADHNQMLVWTSALQDGAPLSDVTINAGTTDIQTRTDRDGLARFELPEEDTPYLVAQQGGDTALLPHSLRYWSDSTWHRIYPGDELRWYVFDDRQMYRPGEDVHIKGWMRRVGAVQDGDVGLVGSGVTAAGYQVIGPQGNIFEEGQAEVNLLGGFDFSFTLPENSNLGYAEVVINAQGRDNWLDNSSYYHTFQVQEFRRPEFEVTTRNETPGPYFAGEHAVVAVSANYYAGGPLPNAEVNWLVSTTPSNYSPPNWQNFVFGTWTPWWWIYEPVYIEEAYYPPDYEFGETETFSGFTDASGEHYLRLDFDESDEPRPFSILAEATVIDVNRQGWTAGTTLLVHPAELYVGLRSERTFVERGTPLDIELIVTDLDGIPVPGQNIEVTAARLEWKYSKGDWRELEADTQECNVESTEEPVTCSFKTPLGGRYQVTAVVTDEQGRKNQSQFTRWVSGGEQPPSRTVEQESVTLVPDQETYQPGDTAQILVQSPFVPAEGLLTVSRSGILYTERFQVEDGTITLQIPIEQAHIPNLHMQVDLVGAAPRTGDRGESLVGVPPRPAYASGQLNLSIPPLQRTLSLQVAPADIQVEPGSQTTVDVVVTDALGQPVADAELAVVVVDEAILALSNYQLADPVSIFYLGRPAGFSSWYGRSSIILADPLALAEAAEAGGELAQDSFEKEGLSATADMEMPSAAPAEESMDESRAGVEPSPIQVRADFNPLATFAPEVRTDANGQAQVVVKLPDNLTRYRVMVVAVDNGNQFGSAEANLVARLPLMVRPSAPRFLNFGDRFELPVVVQNQTDEPMTVDVVVQASNAELTDILGQRITVPANDRLEVRFPATTVMAGTATFQVAAVSGDYADAATVQLPVYTPATTEAFATYGVVDEGAVSQPVAAPNDVFPQFGGLEITTSSTALQALTDAVLYLTSYPYECSEQLSSRILAVAALRDVLTAFSASGLPSPEEMEAAVKRDIERLEGLQNYDGGFPYWTRGHDSIPFNTIHVAHALQRAELKGFEVPEEMQMRLLEHLRDIESYYPHWYNRRTRQTLSAYALYVRDLMGDTDYAKARGLLNEAGLEDLSLEAVAWLWQVLVDDPASVEELQAIRQHINNRVVETAGAANFTTRYTDQDYLLLRSNRRTDAIILDALIADDPESDLIPKVVNGLLAHRTRGRWGNTQENVFVLLALDRYFNTFEATTPNFIAHIWLGDTYTGSHEFIGRTTERHETKIPMVYLTDETLGGGETQNLILSKEGAGRLYYRLGLRYAPTDLDLDPVDMGFVVQRSYEAVDDPEDVYRDEDGIWHINAGARVRVRLTMVADNRRYHVALVDPLPAGLEIVNPALAVTGSIPQDPNSADFHYGWWWWWPWYEHQNMRDERAEAFASLLWEGVYEYTYIARATTPGTFVVPPTKAEEMYSPEVFGRSSSDWVIVE